MFSFALFGPSTPTPSSAAARGAAATPASTSARPSPARSCGAESCRPSRHPDRVAPPDFDSAGDVDDRRHVGRAARRRRGDAGRERRGRRRQAADETRIEASSAVGRHEIVVRVPKREGRFGVPRPWARACRRDPLPRGRRPRAPDAQRRPRRARAPRRGRRALGLGRRVARRRERLSFTTASGDLSAGAVAGPLTQVAPPATSTSARSPDGAPSSTVSGDVRLGRDRRSRDVNTVSGDVDLELARRGVRVNTVSGDVSLASAPRARALDRRAVGQRLGQSDLDVSDAPGPAEGRAGRAPDPDRERRRPHLARRRRSQAPA